MEKPTLVMLPALMCNEALFAEQYNYLKQYCNIIIPVLKDFNNISDAATYVLDLAPATFYLAGISMGGYIAMEIIKLAPERIKKLCLLATKIDLDTPEQVQTRLDGIKALQSLKNVKINKKYELLLYSPNETTQNLIDNMGSSLGSNTYVNQQQLILSRRDLKGKLRNFINPTLLIAGNNDRITPVAMLQTIAQEIPHSKLVTIDRCSHLIPLDQPIALTSLLEYFIKL